MRPKGAWQVPCAVPGGHTTPEAARAAKASSQHAPEAAHAAEALPTQRIATATLSENSAPPPPEPDAETTPPTYRSQPTKLPI